MSSSTLESKDATPPTEPQSHDGSTALHQAARLGHAARVIALLRQEAIDPDVQTIDGQTPLHMAAQAGHRQVIRALAADPRVDLHRRRYDGKDAIDIAINFDQAAAAHELLLALHRRQGNAGDAPPPA